MAKRRKAGEGTLTKRKDGRWEARVVVGYDEKGMPKTKNVTAVSKAKCLEKLEKLKAELGAVTRKCSPTMSFGEWMDFWYQTYCKNTLKESTQATYEQRIYKQIIPKLGHIPLNQLNVGTLEKFYAQLKSNGRLIRRDIYGPGLSNSVIRSIHAHCRAALEKAVTEKLIRQNPAIGCKLPPKKTPEVKILTPEAMQKLLYQAQIEEFYEMFVLDLATGLRRGEIVGLQWKDIDLENGTLSVTRQVRYVKGELKIEPPKTKASERSIILSACTRNAHGVSESGGFNMAVPIAREKRGCAERSVRMQKSSRKDSQTCRVRARAVPRHAPHFRFQRIPLWYGCQDPGKHHRARKRRNNCECQKSSHK